jgi:hypothetical protein
VVRRREKGEGRREKEEGRREREEKGKDYAEDSNARCAPYHNCRGHPAVGD